MKFLPPILAVFPILSCSDSDKFSGENNQQIRIEEIYCETDESGKLYLYGFSLTGIESCTSLEDIGTCGLNDYFWIIDNDTIFSNNTYIDYNAGYGEHSVKLVLLDVFGDTLSADTIVHLNEPLRIKLLSPINTFQLQNADSVKFQYKISGEGWENIQAFLYLSPVRDSLWKEENRLENNILPIDELTEPRYFWGVMAKHTEYEPIVSEIRYILIGN
jgi:hypothetical protein